MHYVNISLIIGEKSVDLALPSRMEVRRLIKELEKIFEVDLVQKKYQILVRNKGLVLDEGMTLAQAGVLSGDILEIEKERV